MPSQAYRNNFNNIHFGPLPPLPKPEPVVSKRADFPTPMIARDYPPYECPITGKAIEGRAAHRENLKKHGCRVLEPGETEQVKRNGTKARDAELEKQIENCAVNVCKELGV